MADSYFSEQTPQEREGSGCGSEPTPLMPMVLCILAVGVAMALVQVSWAAPLLIGTVLLAVVATVRNGIEDAEETDAKGREVHALPEMSGQPQPPFQKPAHTRRRFTGDDVWGLN